MIFNSVVFLIFLPAAFGLYWLISKKSLKFQNIYLLAISYFFYGCWDWRFLFLISFSSLIDYQIGKSIPKAKSKKSKKILVGISLLMNLGLLGFFKYFNFFIESFTDLFNLVGFKADYVTLHIILPVGISFYTFQTLSYTIDVYREKIEPSKSWIQFFAYVSFFPQLVAGPIERATNLLPQFQKKRTFSYDKAADGMRQMLWGFFKKVVVADNCAVFVDAAFDNPGASSSGELFIGMLFFAFQLYGDFAGYSDIAIGSARLFGFDLKQNFAYPYFARDIAEFYRRWHMSLTNWFKDYLYFPLGGSRVSLNKNIRNVFIIYLVSGFWHGANWTFIFWGFLNALYYVPLMLFKRNRKNLEIVAANSYLPSLREGYAILETFIVTCFIRVFFRANTIEDAFLYIKRIFMFEGNSFDNLDKVSVLVIVFMLMVEWLNRKKEHGLSIANQPVLLRWGTYFLIFGFILFFGKASDAFIYFQF
ncbi:MBOAT family protein [Muricauda sp. HICW]|uniref:MBOAT family protein n=1 Tax=Flagellimonas chongwuensis TaxID=2697365 RepID=A0A850NPS3_9FLAO|nr:MBOAT family protein [Allomuricauda chongwuensis]